jgi:hypothetical protein
MLPRQFKALVQMLRDELSALRQVGSEQVSAIRDGKKTAHEDRGKIERAVAAVQTPEGDRAHERTYREKHYHVQVVLTVVTGLAFLAAAVYAGLARRQLKVMQNTYSEIQKQTRAAELAAYVSCKNAEIARDIFIQTYNGGADTRATARGSIQQALAITESVAAAIDPEISTPVVNSQGTYQIPIKLNNGGGSDARNIFVKVRAAYLSIGEEPPFSYEKFTTITDAVLKKGSSSPRSGWMGIPVLDEKGLPLANSEIVRSLFAANKGQVLMYGHISYLDVFGFHRWRNFCSQIRGANSSKDDVVGPHGPPRKCIQYNQEESFRSIPGETIIPPPLPLSIPSEMVCRKPSD